MVVTVKPSLQSLFLVISKERQADTADSSHYSDSARAFPHKLKTEEKHFDQDKDDALAELDSVLNSYHTGSATKSKKKRKDRESFKNGGTWPRARGGPVIEQGTGTILHPHKYKERLPLSELITNVPKYPIDAADEEHAAAAFKGEETAQSVIYREDPRLRHSRIKHRNYRATTYDLGKLLSLLIIILASLSCIYTGIEVLL